MRPLPLPVDLRYNATQIRRARLADQSSRAARHRTSLPSSVRITGDVRVTEPCASSAWRGREHREPG